MIFALDDPYFLAALSPAMFSVLGGKAIVDHFALSVESLGHFGEDVIVGFTAGEGERVDIITCDILEPANFVENIFRKVLAAWTEDVLLVFKDIIEGSARSVMT